MRYTRQAMVAPVSSQGRNLRLGVGLVSLGVVGVIVRFALFPLDLGLGMPWRALVPATLAALTITGVQLARAARRGGGKASGQALALSVGVGAALAVAVGAIVAPRGATRAAVARATGSAVEIPLVEQRVPGLRLTLPEWERTALGDQAAQGTLELADPGGLERYLELRWSVGEPLPRETLVELLSPPGSGLTLREVRPVTVAGGAAEVLYLETARGGKRVAVTQWTCPRDTRTFVLTSFLTLERGLLLDLHEAIIDSVKCEQPPAPDQLGPRLPTLAGDDLTRHEQPTGVLYTTAADEAYFFSAGMQGQKLADAFGQDLTLRRSIIGGLGLRPQAGAFEGAPQRRGDPPRSVWRGQVIEAETGEPFDVLITAFDCPSLELSFFGMHVPAGGEPDPGAAARLASARCPTP